MPTRYTSSLGSDCNSVSLITLNLLNFQLEFSSHFTKREYM